MLALLLFPHSLLLTADAPASTRWRSSSRGAALLMSAPVAEATAERLRFLTPQLAREVLQAVGTPAFVYDEATLKAQARKALAFPNAYGLTVRFAMKALPNAAVLQIFDKLGLHIDASSGFEVRRAIAAGVDPSRISLSSQEIPNDLDELLALGIKFNACSLRQLERFGELRSGARGDQLGVRFNPGLGSGGTGKTNVGGPASSFGIWHELMPEVQRICEAADLQPKRVHTHIGSGSDPMVWQRVAGLSLALVEQLPSVSILNLGGGYKVGRMSGESSTDLSVVGLPVKDAFEAFAQRTGRELHLEVEPGTFLVANSGSLVCTIQDIVTTGADGHTFLKLDSGMTELLRPSLYGAQHPVVLVPSSDGVAAEPHEYIAVGHCCESGDLVTPAPGEPETLMRRTLEGKASIGDIIVVEGSGAYCSSMSTKNYNSFPEAPEMLLSEKGTLHLVRKKQIVSDIWANEVPYTP